MTNLDKLLTDFKEARSAATENWEHCGCRFSIVSAEYSKQEMVDIADFKICDLMTIEQAQNNKDFAVLAANKSDKLIRILEVMGVALKQISENKKLTIMNESDDFMEGAHAGYVRQAEEADEALQQAEKIAGEK